MKLLLLGLLVAVVLSANETLDCQRTEALKLMHELDSYARSLYGCPAGPVVIDTSLCHLGAGTVDYAAFMKARKTAAKVFAFRD